MFYKKFLIVFFTVLTLGFGSVLFINFMYDPANIYNDGLVSKAVGIMLKGEHVLGLSNYNERQLKKTFIVKDIKEINTVVFGSSRSMSITSNDDSLRNYSVSGAVLEDILGLWSVCDDTKNYKNVIIGVDAWLFNKNSGEKRWKTLNKDYANALMKVNINNSNGNSIDIDKYWQLLSLDYLKASIKVLRNKDKGSNLEGVTNLNLDKMLLLKDGSIYYGRSKNEVSVTEVNIEVKKYLKGGIYHLEGFDKLDENRIVIFKKFLEGLINDKKRVVLLLTPYHPVVYEYLASNDRYKMVLETEKIIRALATVDNISIMGSFDPNKCGLNEFDFLDGMHLKNSSVDSFVNTKI